jgi:dTDP-4-amino-4,6-dideoxygalactose transaminase
MSRSASQFAPWPSYTNDEIEAVRSVLASGKVNYWTGTEAREFEREHAVSAATRHAIALANGTVALELALAVYVVGPGDEVITSPRTFVASASCAVMRGALPIFADVDPDSQNITAASIERVLTKKTRALIPVHLAGWPCEMDAILELAQAHNLIVIEDCAQASGALYKGRPVGGLGHAGAFSFCQDKIITTGGEGGMLTISDEAIWSRAWSFKDHGKSFDAVFRREHSPGYRWLHESFGTNWRMTEMQAAIGRLQLRNLPQSIKSRTENASLLREGLIGTPGLRIPSAPDHIQHAYYKFYVFVELQALRAGWSRDRIMAEVGAKGVPCFSGSCSEVYLEKAFDPPGYRPANRLPVARELGDSSLMFLVHPTLGAEQMEFTKDAVTYVMREAIR